jgi:hypothetical protein
MNETKTIRWHWMIGWTIGITLVTEGITAYLRFGTGVNAVEFNSTAPLLLQIHHMFWCIPLFLAAPLVWRFPRVSGTIMGIGCGLVISDLIHHFIVLPLTVGNIGWHWP